MHHTCTLLDRCCFNNNIIKSYKRYINIFTAGNLKSTKLQFLDSSMTEKAFDYQFYFIKFIEPNHYESYKVLNHSIKASNQNTSYRLYVYIATIYDTRYYIIFMNITNIETIKDAQVFI